MSRYLLLFDSYGLVFVGRFLWREDGSVFCVCCWPLPVQSFSGLSPWWLATIFYCLRLETSLFIASYDSQGHVGGIRPPLSLWRNGSWSSLHSLGTDRTVNTASKSSSIVTCMSVAEITWRLLSHCLLTGVFAEPFPSNGCLCWLRNSFSRHAAILTNSLGEYPQFSALLTWKLLFGHNPKTVPSTSHPLNVSNVCLGLLSGISARGFFIRILRQAEHSGHAV
jgi:hypothetical protein